MGIKEKDVKKKINFRQVIDHVVEESTWKALLLVLGICSVNVIFNAFIAAGADFLFQMIHLSFNGAISSALIAVLNLVRNVVITLIVFDLVLKKDVLKLDKNIRYVVFIMLNYLAYVGCGFFVMFLSGQNSFSFLVSSLLNYFGIGALFRLIQLLGSFSGMLRYAELIEFLGYVLYQCIEIMSIAFCTGWIVKLTHDEAAEHDISLKEALIRPFRMEKEVVLSSSKLQELSFVQIQDEVIVDTGLLPVSEELVDLYCVTHCNYFGTDKMPMVRQKLMMLSEKQYQDVTALDYINPDMMLIISAVSGSFGLDRFLLHDTAIGILKMLTFGCFGILTLIDVITIKKKTQDLNFQKMMSI